MRCCGRPALRAQDTPAVALVVPLLFDYDSDHVTVSKPSDMTSDGGLGGR